MLAMAGCKNCCHWFQVHHTNRVQSFLSSRQPNEFLMFFWFVDFIKMLSPSRVGTAPCLVSPASSFSISHLDRLLASVAREHNAAPSLARENARDRRDLGSRSARAQCLLSAAGNLRLQIVEWAAAAGGIELRFLLIPHCFLFSVFVFSRRVRCWSVMNEASVAATVLLCLSLACDCVWFEMDSCITWCFLSLETVCVPAL